MQKTTSIGEVTELGNTVALERHFSVGDVSQSWNFSPKTVFRIFEKEEGVLRLEHFEELHKRSYCTLRIPESVVSRVHERLSQRPEASSVRRRKLAKPRLTQRTARKG